MVPAVLSVGCSFMLPAATAPNAIVFGSNLVPAQATLRHDAVLNVIGIMVVTGVCWLVL